MSNNTNITNGQLLRWHNELKQLSDVNSIFYQFNRSKIQEFYRQNGIRIDSLFRKTEELRKEYFVIEEGQIKQIDVDGKKEPVMLPEKSKEDFTKKYQELMEGQVSIIL